MSYISDLGKKAQTTCKEISTYDEIKAAELGKDFGKLQEKIDLNLSDDTKKTIISLCNNIFSSNQENIIDSGACLFCIKNPDKCNLENINQSNISENKQKCYINESITKSIIDKPTVDLIGIYNSINKNNNIVDGKHVCNLIDINMSSQDYLNLFSQCLNEVKNDQSNILIGCGNMYDNYQNNVAKNVQTCVVSKLNIKPIEEDTNILNTNTSNGIEKQKVPALYLLYSIITIICILIIAAIIISIIFFI
jgi:hypothetical protein